MTPVILDHHVDAFRLAMRHTAQTVTVLTTGGEAWGGMTATSMTSVSMEPPMVLVCVKQSASLWPRLAVDQPVCLNILADHQSALSNIFAGAVPDQDRFQTGDWLVDGDGTPFLNDAAAHIFARIIQRIDAGTHTIFLCHVTGALADPTRQPLIYYDGGYRGLRDLQSTPPG